MGRRHGDRAGEHTGMDLNAAEAVVTGALGRGVVTGGGREWRTDQGVISGAPPWSGSL
jgi:hypothetical protein